MRAGTTECASVYKFVQNGRTMPSSESKVGELAWRKARRSAGNGACVEVASVPGSVFVRDSKSPERATLVLAPSVWQSFLATAKQGYHDLPRS